LAFLTDASDPDGRDAPIPFFAGPARFGEQGA
jgi:hypothetical protein